MSPLLYLSFTVVFISVANLALRHGMSGLGRDGGIRGLIHHTLRTPSVLLGGILYVVSMITWLAALRHLPLGLAYPVYLGGSFALVLLGSVFMLKESLSLQRLIGVLSILVGILLIVR